MLTDEEFEHAKELARANIGYAISQYVELVRNEEAPEMGTPYVTGWAAVCEYTSMELEQNQQAGHAVMVPNDQMIATSVGLYKLGQKRFV